MGFYGNITNTSRTQFQFDKIYPNRKAMEQAKLTDGIYLGRYVLVEYDDDGLDGMKQVYIRDNKFYTSPSYDNSTRLNNNNTVENEVVYYIHPTEGYLFYKRTSTGNNGEAAEFDQITNGTETAYVRNFNIDKAAYGAGRGYDSTVWQKVYSNEQEKYVMIAELNTVVPTFDVVAEAPTMNPVVPHFDTQSTDVYYKLHWQAPWGFRVAAAENENKSDITTEWTTTTYNRETGENETSNPEIKNAAIYFNKDAFDAQVNSSNIKKKDDSTANEIKILPVSSGQAIYDDHDNTTINPVSAPDIQELTINLPAIGNMMSDAWDIIHGPNRDNARTDENGSLQGRLDSFKDMAADEIPVKRGSDGTIIGATINGGKTSNEDLTGRNDDAWIETMVNGNIESITIKHTFNPVVDTASTSDINNNGNTINLYTPKVDEMGHVVGKNIETVTLPYGFKTIRVGSESNETDGMAAAAGSVVADNTQDTLAINPGNKWIHIGASDTNGADEITLSHEVNTIDTAAKENTDLNNGTDTITIQDTQYDNAGHVTHNQKHVYTLPYGFKTIKTNGRGDDVDSETQKSKINTDDSVITTSVVADNTQDELIINSGNKWIRIDTDATSDSITITHDVHSTSSTNNTTDWTTTETNTTIPTVTYTYDDAGHYVSHHTENYKLPFGYGKIKGDSGNTAATATYDELTFTSDEWLTATVSEDKVTYTHDFTARSDTTTKANKNNDNETDNSSNAANKGQGDTLDLYTPQIDAKGHVVGKNIETVTLPYGYKTFKDSETTPGQSVASSTQDIMTLQGDTWVKPTVSNDLIKINHIGPVTATHTSKENKAPKFGDNFTIEDHYYDNKGHIYTTETHTITIPKGSLTDNSANGADVITQLTFTDSTGALGTTRTNISNLLLTDYSKKTNNSDIAATDALGDALSKLQTQIHDTKTTINNLDYAETADNTKIITQITQTDGKITNVSRAAAGTLTLGSGYSVATKGEAINGNDSLNSAFGKMEKSLNEEKTRAEQQEKEINDRINALIGGDNLNTAFDTLKEVADWLENNDSNADKVIDDIAILNGTVETEGSVAHSVKQAIDNEVNQRNEAIVNAINSLDVTDVAVESQYISAVSEVDGKIQVSRTSLPVYTLASGLINGTVKFNNTDVAVTGLKSAAYREEVYFVSKTQYDLDMSTKDAQINGLNTEAKRLTNENINLTNKVNELVKRIEILESKLNLTE